MTALTPADLEVLAQWDAPTIRNALEPQDARHRTGGFTPHYRVCLFPAQPLPSLAVPGKTPADAAEIH